MKERPILFSPPMVRALLNGAKTQTRRVVKPKHLPFVENLTANFLGGKWGERPTPYGKPGDRLWVREAWRAPSSCDRLPPRSISDSEGVRFMAEETLGADPGFGKGRPGMFMPRWASRITLEITEVRVERLQDISEADAIAEGCTKNHNGYFWGGPHAVIGLKQMTTAQKAYRDLWESINGPGSWEANPWVWAVSFKRLEGATP
jgi:hypothetical protein